MSFRQNIAQLSEILREKLAKPLPAFEAQQIMEPSFRNDYKFEEELMRESGVLLLLYPKKGIPHLVLMKRSAKLRTHSGQISLPGGKKDETDTSFYQTAVRETFEELGVKETDIEFLGELTPLIIPITNFVVYPFVAFSEKELIFQPNPAEVENVLEVPIAQLLDEKTVKEEVWEKKGKGYKRPYFDIENQKVWGATAMIISEFRQILLAD